MSNLELEAFLRQISTGFCNLLVSVGENLVQFLGLFDTGRKVCHPITNRSQTKSTKGNERPERKLGSGNPYSFDDVLD